VRRHINPAFGPLALEAIRREQIQAWVKHGCDKGLAPRTVRTSYGILASILRAAVLDEVIARSRCVCITLPKIQPATVHVLSPTQVRALDSGSVLASKVTWPGTPTSTGEKAQFKTVEKQ